jgi:Putative DNA-binding domain
LLDLTTRQRVVDEESCGRIKLVRYQPVRTLPDLQALERSTEGRALDFKTAADPDEWWELAKDIAAFANYVGGTILVGAVEQPSGSAVLRGIDPQEVADLAAGYEMAARDKCKPRPLATTDPIALPDVDRVVLAVNVEPFSLGPVGAMFVGRNQMGQPTPSDGWRFPMRVGKHNIPLQPDQIAMFMEPKIRRTVTLLEEIPHGADVRLFWGAYTDQLLRTKMAETTLAMVSVDVQRNVVAFGAKGTKVATIHVPLDDVDTVWTEVHGAKSVRVAGTYDANTGRYTAGAVR